MPNFKTVVVFEEIIVYDVTYQKWTPPRPYYDGGDGPGSCHEAREGYHSDSTKRGMSETAKDRLVRQLKRNWGHYGRDGDPVVRRRKVWKKVAEKLTTRRPKV